MDYEPFTDKELDDIEDSGACNTRGETTGGLILRLVAEVRRLRAKLVEAYPTCPDCGVPTGDDSFHVCVRRTNPRP